MFFPTIRDYPISGFVGMNGSGKTALAVDRALRIAKGKTLYTTTPISLPEGSDITVHQIKSLSEFKSFENGHVLLDEVNSIFPARGTTTLPHEMVLLLSSLRHKDLTLAWTSPSLEHADISIRRVTQSILVTKSLITKKIPDSLWKQTLVSYLNQYDMTAYSEEEIIPDVTPRLTRGFFRIKGLNIGAYDTHAEVAMLTDHLFCLECGGAKRKEYCNGKHDSKE